MTNALCGFTFNHMVKSNYDLDEIFRALADPTRRAILKRLSRSELVITEVAKPFDMSFVAVAKHIKVLERAQLVERRWDGNFSYLKLNAKAMRSANEWIGTYREFWEQSLDRLENYLKKKAAEEKRKK